MSHSSKQQTRNTSRDDHPASGKTSYNQKDLQDLSKDEANNSYPDYPVYPPSEDIYSNYMKEEEIDIEYPYSAKSTTDKNKQITLTEKEGEIIGDNLDIPGSELDDELEFIGSEDEENNYYSLGGDNHEDLDQSSEDDM